MTTGEQLTTMRDPADLTRFIDGTTREITTAAGRFGLRVSRTYATSATDLWSAWTEPERMARWLGRPFGDLREGGSLRLVMAGPDSVEPPPGETDACANVVVLHCRAPERLTVRWAWGHEPPSIVDLVLTPVADPGTGDERTLLRLEHLVLDQDGATSYGAGWEDFLARLEAAVTGAPTDFPTLEPALEPHWSAAATTTHPIALPTVTTTGDTARLELDRWIDAPPAAVWACLSTSAGLERWYGNAVTGRLHPGGTFRCAFDQGAATGEVLVCEPEHEISVGWRWEGSETTSRMTVTLTPDERDGALGTHVAWREDDATGNVTASGAGLHAHLTGLDRAARGLSSTHTGWSADFVIAMSLLEGHYTNPIGG